MADGLVQHDAGPAGPEHDGHLAGGRGLRLQLDQRLAERLVGGGAPGLLGQELVERQAAAAAVGAGLHPIASLDGNLDVDADEGAHVRRLPPIAADDAHGLQLCRDRGGDLRDGRVLGAEIGVDLLQHADLGGEAGRFGRVVMAVERPIRGRRAVGERSAAAFARLPRRLRSAREGAVADLRAMGVGGEFAGDRPHAEALVDIVVGAAQTAVVEGQALTGPPLQKELAVVGAVEALCEPPARGGGVEVGLGEEDAVGL